MNFDDLYTNVFENQTRIEINPFDEVNFYIHIFFWEISL